MRRRAALFSLLMDIHQLIEALQAEAEKIGNRALPVKIEGRLIDEVKARPSEGVVTIKLTPVSYYPGL